MAIFRGLRERFTSFLREGRYAASPRTSALKVSLPLLLIAVVGAIAYSNTFHVPFVLDDSNQIENNQMIRNLDNFLLAVKGHHFTSGSYRYIPSRFLGYLSFALNYHFGGLDVWGYHLTNLFIHIVNAFLVYFLLKLTFKTPLMRSGHPLSSASGPGASGSGLIALFAALLFVSHPVQTQAVTYVVQRFASLATLFYLLSLVMYIKGRLEVGGKRKEALNLKPLAYYVLSLLSAVLAMKTKEIAFTLPIVIILYESMFFTTPFKKKLLFLLPVVLTIVIVPLSVLHSGKPLGEILSDVSEMTRVQTQLPRWDYLMTELRVITTYIRLIFVPIHQNLDYEYPIYHSLLTPSVFLSFLFLSALFGTAVWLLCRSRQSARGNRQEARDTSTQGEGPEAGSVPIASQLSPIACQRLIAFGIFWFFITLSVESSVIPIVDVIFEHRLYLPSVGLFTAIATGVFLVAARLKKEQILVPIIVVITLALSATTYARNNVWGDEASLWEDVVRKSPHKARPHNFLGVVYAREGRLDEAIQQYQTALRLQPDYAGAHYTLGEAYMYKGQLDMAIIQFQTALWLQPDYAKAHFDLGVIYLGNGSIDLARTEFETVLRIRPDDFWARQMLNSIISQ